jgi:hypothetical protein
MAHLAKERLEEWLVGNETVTKSEKLQARMLHLSVYRFLVWTEKYMLGRLKEDNNTDD